MAGQRGARCFCSFRGQPGLPPPSWTVNNSPWCDQGEQVPLLPNRVSQTQLELHSASSVLTTVRVPGEHVAASRTLRTAGHQHRPRPLGKGRRGRWPGGALPLVCVWAQRSQQVWCGGVGRLDTASLGASGLRLGLRSCGEQAGRGVPAFRIPLDGPFCSCQIQSFSLNRGEIHIIQSRSF